MSGRREQAAEPRELVLNGIAHRLEIDESATGEAILTVWSMGGRGCAVLDQALDGPSGQGEEGL